MIASPGALAGGRAGFRSATRCCVHERLFELAQEREELRETFLPECLRDLVIDALRGGCMHGDQSQTFPLEADHASTQVRIGLAPADELASLHVRKNSRQAGREQARGLGK